MLAVYVFSAKWRELLHEFQEFADVEHLEIIKHCQTRWLSLQRVVERVVNQYPALSAYFASVDGGDTVRLKRLVAYFKDPYSKLIRLFLQFILPILTEFNKLFQVTTN